MSLAFTVREHTALFCLIGFGLLPSQALAGIPECNNLRLEDVGSCRIEGDLECDAGCDRLGIYKKACATQLHEVCRSECTLSAEPTCTDDCTIRCSSDCDLGINITCQHNCFGECSGSCDTQCEGSNDEETCRASCEATCDGECDIQCAPVVNESCYVHCIECCGGSCGAQANMDCQETCQEEEFETCEYELEADCSASCSGSGALFCDGEYVMSGDEMIDCGQALVARGIATANLAANADIDFDTDGVKADLGGEGAAAGCSLGRDAKRDRFGTFALFALALGLGTRRFGRKRR
jgi:hypothetical protein